MDARMQKHRMTRWLGWFVAALLLVLFARATPTQAAVESVAPISGGTVWYTNWKAGSFPSAVAACSSLSPGDCPVCGSLTYVGTKPNLAVPGDMDCVVFYNPGDGTPGWNTLSGTAIPYSNAVCPVPTVNPTVPYKYNPVTGMCERSAQENLTITLSGGTSVEPWHKKSDANHTKTNLTYTATVTNASGQPSPNIPVTITTEVTQDSGGHVHIDGRPKGRLVATPSGTPTPVSTVGGKETIPGITDSNGVFTFTFGSEEASGTHTLTAKCTGCQAPATATVKVEIPGLSLLDGDPLSYTLNGEKSWHPGSHYFSAAALTKIINLAHKYRHDPAFNHQLLIINDSSLIKGGVLDLGQDWTYTPNGHQGHRVGVVADVNNYSNGPNSDFEDFAQRCCKIDAVWEGPDITATPHYHLKLLGKDQ